MLFALFHVVAIAILALHCTGFPARHKLERRVPALAEAAFPAVIHR